MTRDRGRFRAVGVPLWAYLTALIIVPVVGCVLVAGWVVDGSHRAAAAAERAEVAATVVGDLSIADAGVSRELMPTLLAVALRDPAITSAAGVGAAQAGALRSMSQAEAQSAQRQTDGSLARLAATPGYRLQARTALARVRRVRRLAAHAGFAQEAAVFTGYEQLGDYLHGVAGRDSGPVTTSALSARATRSFRDEEATADLLRASSALMPCFLGTVPLFTAASAAPLLAGDASAPSTTSAEGLEQGWQHAWWTYVDARSGVSQVSDRSLRAAWQEALASPAVQELDGVLSAAAGAGSTPATSPTPAPGAALTEVVGLLSRSAAHDAALRRLMTLGVRSSRHAATADAAAAARRARLTLAAALAVVVLTCCGAGLVGRRVSRSLSQLAHDAQEVRHGDLRAVVGHGPREVRTVSAALDDTVASLRRMQEQASAVARGELDSELLDQAVPGPLGEVMHASIRQMVSSVRAREELQGALAHQASHDPLTGLPNRAQAMQLIERALHRAQRAGGMVGLLFVDLDGFKAVNDTWGHASGDVVLRESARRLEAAVRAGDTVCRLGGDEFVALVEPVDAEHDLVDLAARLIEAVTAPITVSAGPSARQVGVGASLGIALSRDGGTSADTLLAEADAAVYRAKAAGGGRAELFDDELRAAMTAQAEMEAAISHALEAGELRLHYQPVVEVSSGALRGYEALVRWDRPGHGMVPPDAFIPVAERSRLVRDIDRWVLTEATRQLALWRAQGSAGGDLDGVTMAVNISGRHLADPGVVQAVADALAAAELPAHLLALEVTETVLVDDPAAFEHLTALRALGVTVAIDDFGTGYTSIGQLRHMPVDTLKIDRSFVASEDPGERGLVSLIIQAAHAFGLTVVAEGVEVDEQLQRLRAEHCDHVQGYLLARPLPPAAAVAFARAADPEPQPGPR